MTYRTILVDPPWPENGGGGRGASMHYKTVPYDGIAECVLRQKLFKPDWDFFLGVWTTVSSLPAAYDLVRACGATPVTLWTWVKTWRNIQQVIDPTVSSIVQSQLAVGTGQYGLQGSVEFIVWAKRGRIARASGNGWQKARAAIAAPIGEHSAKPDVFYEQAQRVFPGPHLAMFERKPREGWDYCGDEV